MLLSIKISHKKSAFSVKPRMLFFPLIHVKMPTIVGILTYMSGEKFMLNSVEQELSFITSGPASFESVPIHLNTAPFQSNGYE